MTSRRRIAALVAPDLLVAACGSPVRPTSDTGRPRRRRRLRPPVDPARSRSRARSASATTGSSSPLTDSTRPEAGRRARIAPCRSATTGPNGETIAPQPQTFIWAIEGVNGVYVGHATFPAAGKWTADFTTAAPGAPSRDDDLQLRRSRQRSTVVVPGDAGAVGRRRRPSPTSAATSRRSRATRSRSSAFYETSEADALAAKKPFVLIFATPKFCQTADLRADPRQAQAGRRRPSRADVHQRRAVQARARRTASSSRS